MTQRRRLSTAPVKSKDEAADQDEEVRLKSEMEEGRRQLKRKCKEFMELERRRQERTKKKP